MFCSFIMSLKLSNLYNCFIISTTAFQLLIFPHLQNIDLYKTRETFYITVPRQVNCLMVPIMLVRNVQIMGNPILHASIAILSHLSIMACKPLCYFRTLPINLLIMLADGGRAEVTSI